MFDSVCNCVYAKMVADIFRCKHPSTGPYCAQEDHWYRVRDFEFVK